MSILGEEQRTYRAEEQRSLAHGVVRASTSAYYVVFVSKGRASDEQALQRAQPQALGRPQHANDVRPLRFRHVPSCR